MPAKLKPKEFMVGDSCTPGCSLNERNFPIFALALQWYCAGDNNLEIKAKADRLGHNVSLGAIGRHRGRHLVPVFQVGVYDPFETASDEKVDHVKVLEQIIARGAKGIAVSKIGPDMTLRAMDMYYKLTQGNAQQSWMDAMNTALSGISAEDPSLKSEEESAQAGAEDASS